MKKNLLSIMIFFTISFAFSQSIFINEIHYDNSGTDENEGFEITGPAGSDLSGFTVVLYKGSNGLPYNTINLTGILSDSGNGFGFIAEVLPTNGLQNGAPDGLALIDNNGNLIQFLSYEGVVNALGGPAEGLSSTDIGVVESSATPIGNSIQLVGTGTVFTDFNWQTELESTFTAINEGQTFIQPITTPLINEFVFNHTGSDTDEFVEIIAPSNTDLSSFYLLEIEGDGTGSGVIDEVIQLGTTDANGFFTSPFGSNTFENGTVSLLLVENFTGSLGDDLDTDNDGVLDILPWDLLLMISVLMMEEQQILIMHQSF